MSTISSDDLRAILAGCEGVTPGPYEIGAAGDYPPNAELDQDHTPLHSDTWGAFVSFVTSTERHGGRVGTGEQGKRNIAHFARLDPQTVASICRELLSLRESHPIEDGDGPTHWAVYSPTGMHIGLWTDRALAEEVVSGYSAGYRIMPLRAVPAAPSNPGTSKVEKPEHSDKLRQGLQTAVDSINSRPPELRGSFKS